MVSEFTGYVKDKKLPVGRNPSSIEAYASIEDNGQLDTREANFERYNWLKTIVYIKYFEKFPPGTLSFFVKN